MSKDGIISTFCPLCGTSLTAAVAPGLEDFDVYGLHYDTFHKGEALEETDE